MGIEVQLHPFLTSAPDGATCLIPLFSYFLANPTSCAGCWSVDGWTKQLLWTSVLNEEYPTCLYGMRLLAEITEIKFRTIKWPTCHTNSAARNIPHNHPAIKDSRQSLCVPRSILPIFYSSLPVPLLLTAASSHSGCERLAPHHVPTHISRRTAQ
jgi:hypothetical protein